VPKPSSSLILKTRAPGDKRSLSFDVQKENVMATNTSRTEGHRKRAREK